MTVESFNFERLQNFLILRANNCLKFIFKFFDVIEWIKRRMQKRKGDFVCVTNLVINSDKDVVLIMFANFIQHVASET